MTLSRFAENPVTYLFIRLTDTSPLVSDIRAHEIKYKRTSIDRKLRLFDFIRANMDTLKEVT